MTARRWTKAAVVTAVLLSTSLAGVSTAAAQTPSPPGFSDCPPVGGPLGADFNDLPAVIGHDGTNMWAGLRSTYGPPGGPLGYTDKIVHDSPRNRYIHARYETRMGTWKRVGCKPKAPNEQPKDTPKFNGGGGGGGVPPSVGLIGGGMSYTFFTYGGVRTGTVTVGEPKPVGSTQVQ